MMMRRALIPLVAALALPAAAHAQDLTIVNRAHVPVGQLKQAERMVIRQANDQLRPAWHLNRTRFVARGGWPIYLEQNGSSMNPAGGPGAAIGYHYVNSRTSRPFAVIWTGATFAYGYAWQGILSHEVMEILVDPQTTRLMGGPTPDVGFIAEVCDPVSDWYYSGNRQDFVTPAWFLKGTPGPWDAMKRLPSSLTESRYGSEGYWDGQQWQSLNRVHASEARHRHVGPPPPSIQAYAPTLGSMR